ncbi:acyl-CoA dehydrogenase family protein [Shinella sp. NM-101]|uniref:acyl-CoA dehydrogenase family protein n=1 Tax=Shinella sp. NM-101 TaxID=2744455 RepID=UPI001AD0F96F|nr:acyl-CoA dehydrogenase family protein [Shinella sp. NM-101]MBN9053431.1 acyl-CoA dehydrogenase family protein [Hyphomicrobiales bacterium]
MGTLSSALDRSARTAAIIGTEDEAIAAAGRIAEAFSLPAQDSAAAEARHELLSRTGLFGISVPTEHGGIDVSNTVLAEVCALAAAGSAALGEVLAAHFVAVEKVRSHGSESQRNTVFSAVLAGARLARASARRNSEAADGLPLAASGLAWRLGGEALCTPCARHADWLLMPVRLDGGRPAVLLLPTRLDGLHYVANSCEPVAGGTQAAEHVLFKDVLVDGDTLLQPAGEAATHGVPRSLDLLLEAARRKGGARAALRHLLDEATGEPVVSGLLSARLAAADAMTAEAGRAIDAAQIGLADQHRTNAFLAAVAALAAAEEAAAAILRVSDPPGEGTVLTASLSPHLRAILGESGELFRTENRRQPETES